MDTDIESKEKMAFDEFKKRMEGDMEKEMYEDDNLFYRFLKARDFNVDNAELMLRQHLEWRKRNDIKNIFKWSQPEVVKNYFILTTLGNDKEGCILKYNHFGNTDFRGIFESCTLEDWLRSLIYFFEQDISEMKKHSERLGKLVDKTVYIENLENFSLAKATDKKDSWKRDILEAIDAEVVPAFLGGKRTDPDGNPLCEELIVATKPVPKSLYLNKSKRPFPTLKDAERISVSRSSAHELFFDVREPGSHLEWEFEIKSGDIRFGILYKDKDGRKIESVPPQKVNTSEYTGSGLYKCEKAGTYIVVFDNSYSFLRTKEIWYKIKVTNPQEQVSS